METKYYTMKRELKEEEKEFFEFLYNTKERLIEMKKKKKEYELSIFEGNYKEKRAIKGRTNIPTWLEVNQYLKDDGIELFKGIKTAQGIAIKMGQFRRFGVNKYLIQLFQNYMNQ